MRLHDVVGWLKFRVMGPKLAAFGLAAGAMSFSHSSCSGSGHGFFEETIGYVEEFFYDDYYYYDDCGCDNGGFFLDFGWL